MKEKTVFKRKIEDRLLSWKSDPHRRPLIVDGLRQVGKSFIVEKFARENYESVITFDFRHVKELRAIFEGNLGVDDILVKAGPYFPRERFVPGKTVLIFEEIGDCPLARTSLKSFAMDGRFDVIGTGSLLGVLHYRRENKADIPTGYETILHMKPMDCEEFLWANGLEEKHISELRKSARSLEPLPVALAEYYKQMLKRYAVIGGMPDAVRAFLATGNFVESRKVLEGLLRDYRADFGRYVDERNEERIDPSLQAALTKVFDSIPAQLARESVTRKFKFAEVKKGGRASEFEGTFEWLKKAGLVLQCYNVKALEEPLTANREENFFKSFLADPGLLMALYPIANTQEFLADELGNRKGAIFESLGACMIDQAGFPLYYSSDPANHREIDFLLETKEGIVLVEEKSTNGKMASSKAVMEGKTPYRAARCIKVVRENFGKGEFFDVVPQYALPFLLEDYAKELDEGFALPPLAYPELP